MHLLLESGGRETDKERELISLVSVPQARTMAAPRLEVGIAATLRLTDASSGNPRLRFASLYQGHLTRGEGAASEKERFFLCVMTPRELYSRAEFKKRRGGEL